MSPEYSVTYVSGSTLCHPVEGVQFPPLTGKNAPPYGSDCGTTLSSTGPWLRKKPSYFIDFEVWPGSGLTIVGISRVQSRSLL